MIEPRRVGQTPECRILWWLFYDREAAQSALDELSGDTLFDEDADWCVMASSKPGMPGNRLFFGIVYSEEPGRHNELFVWDDAMGLNVDDVRAWFDATVADFVEQYGRPRGDLEKAHNAQAKHADDKRTANIEEGKCTL